MTAHPTAPAFELRSGGSWRDPFPMYRALRDHDPVHRVEANGQTGSFWFLSRFEDVFTAVRDTDAFSSAHGLTVDPDAPGTQMGDATPIVFMDPPDHTTMRRLVSAGFTPRQVTELEDEIRALLHLLDTPVAGPANLVAPGTCRNVEFVRELARALRRPAVLPAPALALRAVLGEMADGLLLASARVRPVRLEESGFTFRSPDLTSAIAEMLSPGRPRS